MHAKKDPSEEDYLEYLAHERHMYAWCLRVHGGRADDDAVRDAAEVYPYVPASNPHRWLTFHDEAWHWAMLRIHGSLYWHAHRELAKPSLEYRHESDRFDADRGRARSQT